MSAPAMQADLGLTQTAATSVATPVAVNVGDALVAAFNEAKGELVGTLVYLLGSQDDAHDAAQETFMKCWRNLEELKQVHNLRAFIFRVAMNTATDIRRSAWRRKAKPMGEEEMYAAPVQTSHENLERHEQVDRLRKAIRALRQEEQEVFLLRQNGEMTYEQIAEMRNMPVGTVKTQMRTALQKLRKLLDVMPGGEPC
jgi:RNA polymerase sigma-70 factor, ECF subfamily